MKRILCNLFWFCINYELVNIECFQLTSLNITTTTTATTNIINRKYSFYIYLLDKILVKSSKNILLRDHKDSYYFHYQFFLTNEPSTKKVKKIDHKNKMWWAYFLQLHENYLLFLELLSFFFYTTTASKWLCYHYYKYF